MNISGSPFRRDSMTIILLMFLLMSLWGSCVTQGLLNDISNEADNVNVDDTGSHVSGEALSLITTVIMLLIMFMLINLPGSHVSGGVSVLTPWLLMLIRHYVNVLAESDVCGGVLTSITTVIMLLVMVIMFILMN